MDSRKYIFCYVLKTILNQFEYCLNSILFICNLSLLYGLVGFIFFIVLNVDPLGWDVKGFHVYIYICESVPGLSN